MHKHKFQHMLTPDVVNGVQDICKPLFRATPIHAYQFIRLYENGASIHMSSEPEWLETFFSKKLYLGAKLFKDFHNYQSGFYIRDYWKLNSSRYTHSSKIAANDFNLDHSLSIVKKQSNYCDIFETAMPRNTTNSDEFYHAHADLLDQFSEYFIEKGKRLISQTEKNKIFVSFPKDFDVHHICEDTGKGFLDSEIIRKLQQSEPYSKLNQKEKQILAWLFQGKTLVETANILNISIKTIEKIMPRIKAKLNCDSLFQVGAKLSSFQYRIMLEDFLQSLV